MVYFNISYEIWELLKNLIIKLYRNHLKNDKTGRIENLIWVNILSFLIFINWTKITVYSLKYKSLGTQHKICNFT